MTIEQLTEQMDYRLLTGSCSQEISALVYDSRKIVPGCMFVCIKGAVFDGHTCIDEAAQKQAAAVVVEQDVQVPAGMAVLKVPDTRRALAELSAAWFHHPAKQLKTIGITGTKGKTTTTYMIKSILESTGRKVGLIGTIEVVIGEEHIPAANTTPESYLIQQYFRKMVDAGCDACVMEVSSQGLMMHRVGGFTFDIGIFTNIEPDHIGPNEHASFEDYLDCKRKLFHQCKTGIVNADDAHVNDMIKGHTCEIETYGFSDQADLRAQDIRLIHRPGYLGVAYHAAGICDFDVEIDVPGKFSVYNSLTAVAVCRHFQVPVENMKQALRQAKVKGRIEMVKVSDEFTLMIDYAHNALSMECLLQTLRDYRPKRLICLFGGGGNRPRQRRLDMGRIAGKYADLTIITMDNPRDEPMEQINQDIMEGLKVYGGAYQVITDREEAIKYLIDNCADGDIVALIGKGHEEYQEIKGVKYHFSEEEIVAKYVGMAQGRQAEK